MSGSVQDGAVAIAQGTRFVASAALTLAGAVATMTTGSWLAVQGGPMWAPIAVEPATPWPIVSIDPGYWTGVPNSAAAMFPGGSA